MHNLTVMCTYITVMNDNLSKMQLSSCLPLQDRAAVHHNQLTHGIIHIFDRGWSYFVDKRSPPGDRDITTGDVFGVSCSTESMVVVEVLIGNKPNGGTSRPLQLPTLVEENGVGLGAIGDQNTLESVGLVEEGGHMTGRKLIQSLDRI